MAETLRILGNKRSKTSPSEMLKVSPVVKVDGRFMHKSRALVIICRHNQLVFVEIRVEKFRLCTSTLDASENNLNLIDLRDVAILLIYKSVTTQIS